MMESEPVRRAYIQRCPHGGWCIVLQCTFEGRTLWVELRGFWFHWTAMRKAKRFTEDQMVYFMPDRDFHAEEKTRLDA